MLLSEHLFHDESTLFQHSHIDHLLQTVQLEFLSAVESMNPDRIMKILNQHPMHIDSMLQVLVYIFNALCCWLLDSVTIYRIDIMRFLLSH